MGEWRADLGRAVRVWRARPVLPAIGSVVAAAAFLPQLFAPQPAGCAAGTAHPCTSGNVALFAVLAVALLPVSVYAIGLFGAERWWYVEVDSGRTPPAGLLWTMAWRYLGRFLLLGLLVTGLSLPVVVPIAVAYRLTSATGTLALSSWAFAVDVLLTFVTPALAVSTTSPWAALRIGLRALVQQWPRDGFYVLIPPMALTVVARLAPYALGSRLSTAIAGAVAQLLTMLFAGATVLFYARTVAPAQVPPWLTDSS
jgi:hypothetical protein